MLSLTSLKAMSKQLEKLIHSVTKALAVVAGGVLVALALLTVISIGGRSLIWAGLAPIPGDFELVEIGTAVAVFGFLPYCHLHRGHVTVDVIVNQLPTSLFNLLTIVGDLAVALVTYVVAWRLWLGLQDKLAYGESTMILGAPLWVGYLLCFIAALWACGVVLYVLLRDCRAWQSGDRLAS